MFVVLNDFVLLHRGNLIPNNFEKCEIHNFQWQFIKHMSQSIQISLISNKTRHKCKTSQKSVAQQNTYKIRHRIYELYAKQL